MFAAAHADVLEFWGAAETRLLVALASATQLRTPTSFIVHSLSEVNTQLERGSDFFVDLLRDGVMLFVVPGHPFATVRHLAREDALTRPKAITRIGCPVRKKP